jgi:hypothetical protein
MPIDREAVARRSAALLLVVAAACDPNVVIGSDAPRVDASLDATVDVDAGVEASVDASIDSSVEAGVDANLDAAPDTNGDSGLSPLPYPWSTSFENGYSDYQSYPDSLCYYLGSAFFMLVGSPVHTGKNSVGFQVTTDADGSVAQTRCYLSGVLPASAYYGAWFYVPNTETNSGNWNLIHFQGSTGPNGTVENLWDISLVNDARNALHVMAHDFLDSKDIDAGGVPPIPIGSWFHLEVYLQRSSVATGRFTLYQDGVVAVDVTGIKTDDTAWGQFFVGSLATALTPPSLTIYVDDVSVGPAL